ncbi:hypothetical protein [Microlunatus sp. GCM10028923]|uniref:hypothetical protein n=1 Tax=Microlunatus sp. GCM10028923 TaxID=3273400 RepID=UPI003614963A
MSTITSVSTATQPTLAGLSRNDSYLPTTRVLELSRLPMLIMVVVNVIFFVAYWLPELARGNDDPLLGQLAPLASAAFATGGEAWFSTQRSTGTWLLIFGLAIAVLIRSRHWVARLILFPVAYLGAALVLVMIFGVIIRGELFGTLLSVLLGVVWVATAITTTWRSLWQNIDDLPDRRPPRIWPLVLACVAAVIPLAVGRAVFAPELRQAAADLAVSGSAMRWAALFTEATPRLYLAGVGVLVAGWAAWRLLPGRRPERPAGTVVALLIALVLGMGGIGMTAAQLAAQRTEQIRSGDPTPELLFSCVSWRQPGEGPARTLVVHGAGCQQLSGFTGYTPTTDRALGYSISPVKASLPGGPEIASDVISASYGEILVIAGTDRFDDKANRIVGLRVTDGTEVWSFPCAVESGRGASLELRFAGAPDGDDPTAGRLTDRGESESVVAVCGGVTKTLDPRTGAEQ